MVRTATATSYRWGAQRTEFDETLVCPHCSTRDTAHTWVILSHIGTEDSSKGGGGPSLGGRVNRQRLVVTPVSESLHPVR
jgi:hypothetical protein